MKKWMGQYAFDIGKTSRPQNVLSHLEKWFLGFILESFLHELRIIQAWSISESTGRWTQAPSLNVAAPWTDLGMNGGSHHCLPKKRFRGCPEAECQPQAESRLCVQPGDSH